MKPLRIRDTRRTFSAARDDAGVPHIEARTLREALFGLGFMHATDRPTQLLFARAMAQGVAASAIADKEELVETDRFFRRADLGRNLRREVGLLDDWTFAHLTAYCEGVNDGLRQAGRSLPMWATGFQITPWTQESVLLMGALLSFGGLAVGQQQNERLILELIHAGVSRERLNELFELDVDPDHYDLLRQIKISRELSDEALDLITDLPRLAGSNAWAVGPGRSATGGALLAADPHLEINRLPAIWYEAVLRWDGRYALGATLPGTPLFGVGRTACLAWGTTYTRGDTSDYFIEDCRLEAGRWQYRRGDEWRDLELQEAVIGRKGKPDQRLRIWHTDLGVVDGDPEATGPGYYLATAWTGQMPGAGRALTYWLRLLECPGAAEGRELVRQCPQPTLNWVLADRGGHIARQASGWYPQRRDPRGGLLPLPGWEAANHWTGVLPAHRLPGCTDPACGYVGTANESINEAGSVALVTHPVGDYRVRRIEECLAELPRATVEDMQRMQYDVVSTQARDLLEVLLPLLPEGPLRERLARWDLRYAPESTDAVRFGELYRHVLLEIFGHDTAEGGIGWRRMLYLSSRVGFSIMVVVALDRLLRQEHSLWWQGRDKAELVRRAAQRAEREPERPWSAVNHFRFTNRFLESDFVGRALGFHTSDLPMPGCHATLFSGHVLRSARRETTFAPSYHFVTDLARDEAWTNLPGGPSESRFSGLYTSDIPLWAAGRYKRIAAE